MIEWGTSVYGAALSAVIAVAAVILVFRELRPLPLALVAVTAAAAPIAWNAVLRSTSSPDFFVDAPLAVFPVSWQDVGSGVWTLALAGAVQGLSQASARRGVALALVTAAAAFIVDIYLY